GKCLNRLCADQFVDDLAFDVRQTEVPTAVAIREFGMVDSHQMEDRGMQVVNVDGLIDDLEAKLVGGTVNISALDPTAGQPDGKAERVVVAAVLRSALSADLGDGRATELRTADDQSILEQAASFEILDHRGTRSVGVFGILTMLLAIDVG